MPDHRKPRPPGRRPFRGKPQDRPPRAEAPRRENRQAEPAGPERLQKVLAHAGLGSRRSCEEMILQGRVTVDGKTIRELGTKVEPSQKIAVDGQPIHPERPVYFAVYKPRGYVSTNNDPAGRPRVIDLLPEVPQRIYSVGRLDEASTGLMLLTNDGELANKLAHPRFGVEKVYRVVVAGTPERSVFDQLTEGVWLAEGKVRAKRVRAVGRKGEATVLEMVLAEGKNREIRRMLARLGHKVMSLTRIAIGPIRLKGLKPGQARPLSAQELFLLRQAAAGQWKAAPESERPPRRAFGRRPGRAQAQEQRPPRPTGPAARRSKLGPPPSRRASNAPPPEVEPTERRVIGLDPPRRGPKGADRRPRPAPRLKRRPRPGDEA